MILFEAFSLVGTLEQSDQHRIILFVKKGRAVETTSSQITKSRKDDSAYDFLTRRGLPWADPTAFVGSGGPIKGASQPGFGILLFCALSLARSMNGSCDVSRDWTISSCYSDPRCEFSSKLWTSKSQTELERDLLSNT